jgi:hypothetical protein
MRNNQRATQDITRYNVASLHGELPNTNMFPIQVPNQKNAKRGTITSQILGSKHGRGAFLLYPERPSQNSIT